MSSDQDASSAAGHPSRFRAGRHASGRRRLGLDSCELVCVTNPTTRLGNDGLHWPRRGTLPDGANDHGVLYSPRQRRVVHARTSPTTCRSLLRCAPRSSNAASSRWLRRCSRCRRCSTSPPPQMKRGPSNARPWQPAAVARRADCSGCQIADGGRFSGGSDTSDQLEQLGRTGIAAEG